MVAVIAGAPQMHDAFVCHASSLVKPSSSLISQRRWRVAGTFHSSLGRAAQAHLFSLPPLGRTETRRSAQPAM